MLGHRSVVVADEVFLHWKDARGAPTLDLDRLLISEVQTSHIERLLPFGLIWAGKKATSILLASSCVLAVIVHGLLRWRPHPVRSTEPACDCP